MIEILVYLVTLKYEINRVEVSFQDTKCERYIINTRHSVQSNVCEKQPLSLQCVPEKAVTIRVSPLLQSCLFLWFRHEADKVMP